MKLSKALIYSAVSAVALSASSVFAAGPDYTEISAGIDFSSTTAVIMTAAVGGIALLLSMTGIKKVFYFIRSI